MTWNHADLLAYYGLHQTRIKYQGKKRESRGEHKIGRGQLPKSLEAICKAAHHPAVWVLLTKQFKCVKTTLTAKTCPEDHGVCVWGGCKQRESTPPTHLHTSRRPSLSSQHSPRILLCNKSSLFHSTYEKCIYPPGRRGWAPAGRRKLSEEPRQFSLQMHSHCLSSELRSVPFQTPST